jgi:hypothetical protein
MMIEPFWLFDDDAALSYSRLEDPDFIFAGKAQNWRQF